MTSIQKPLGYQVAMISVEKQVIKLYKQVFKSRFTGECESH